MPRKPMGPDEFRAMIEKRQEDARSSHRRLQNEAYLFQETQKLKEEHSIAMQDVHARYAEEFAEVMAGMAAAVQCEETPEQAMPKDVYNAVQRLQKQVECVCRNYGDDSPSDRETNVNELLKASDHLRVAMGHPFRPWGFNT